ncbi:OmpA family protein [Pseudobacteriovorax antillogorgiicola]|uniref:OmpA-like domain-containing protein n=1 Tax=Pseudobacteriovorax antillogorgiicola TaxID=1513793 RepID=A0A1Y6CIY5_9BACT|nr:OmpA family protein [Pseudobacteriovorax antillogorgiicola]TCS47004.1 uncharacterized protein DUF4398 [Pseudobacteriovorax antillogorgiicola]SMF64980.1 protein of unknown function [Pseudobacteriovorax antillogorgiicola]
MKLKLPLFLLLATSVGCASNDPESLKKAEIAVEKSEEKDADDLTPRMMELANEQLDQAQDLWDDAVDAREDQNYAKSEKLAQRAQELAISAKALADRARTINKNVEKWDKNPRLYNAASQDKLLKRIEILQAQLKRKPAVNVAPGMTADAAVALVDQMPIAYFPYKVAEPKNEFVPHAKNLAKVMNNHPGLKLELYGYADPRGTEEYNQELAKKRAYNISQILIREGVAKNRIKIVSSGEVNSSSRSVSDMQLYRKVEATLINAH